VPDSEFPGPRIRSLREPSPPLHAYRVLTPWGPLALVGRQTSCLALFLPEESDSLTKRVEKRFPKIKWTKQTPDFAFGLESPLMAYFQGKKKDLPEPPMEWLAPLSSFQRRVYKALGKTRPGQKLTYGELAQKAGFPGAARAVGSAMAKNPWPLIVPCHRVIPAGGRKVGAYSGAGGTKTKVRLLEWEGDGNRISNH
jgi:methylated-DNA-[protein]-cysteine S-methyltransferase